MVKQRKVELFSSDHSESEEEMRNNDHLYTTQDDNNQNSSFVGKIFKVAVSAASAALSKTPLKQGGGPVNVQIAVSSSPSSKGEMKNIEENRPRRMSNSLSSQLPPIPTAPNRNDYSHYLQPHHAESSFESSSPIASSSHHAATTEPNNFRQQLSTKNDRRRQRVPWSHEEETYLLDGIKKFGTGNWAKILSEYPFDSHRNGVDLKDKYRNIQKMQQRMPYGAFKIVDICSMTGHESPFYRYSYAPSNWQGPRTDTSEWRQALVEYAQGIRDKYELALDEIIKLDREGAMRMDNRDLNENRRFVTSESLDVFHDAQEKSTQPSLPKKSKIGSPVKTVNVHIESPKKKYSYSANPKQYTQNFTQPPEDEKDEEENENQRESLLKKQRQIKNKTSIEDRMRRKRTKK